MSDTALIATRLVKEYMLSFERSVVGQAKAGWKTVVRGDHHRRPCRLTMTPQLQ